MEKLSIMWVCLCCVATLNIKAQGWELQDQFSFPEPQAIHFLNSTHGWIGGKHQLAATTDGGDTWSMYTLPDQNVRIRGMHAIDENTLIVAGRHDDLEAFIGKTFDGGMQWIIQTGFPERLEDVAFATPETGVSVGRKGLVLRTTDGGTNWNALQGFGSTDFKHVNFKGNTGIMSGEGGAIRRSTDAGLTWTPVPSGTTQDLGQVHFVDANIIYIAGDGGVLLRSTDGGLSFSPVPVPTPNNLRGVYFTDAGTGWVVGFVGTILMTTQGGDNWVDQSTAIPHQFQRIGGGGPGSVFCGNENGEVYRYVMSTATSQSAVPAWAMSPNPATQNVYFSSPTPFQSLRIYDAAGKLVYVRTGEEIPGSIDVSHFPAGLYTVQVIDASGHSTAGSLMITR